MQNTLTFRHLTLARPIDFHGMDQSEWSKMNLLTDGETSGHTDPERHMIVTVGYKQVNGFS